MAQGRKTALTLRLTPAERRTLLTWQRATAIRAGLVRRARPAPDLPRTAKLSGDCHPPDVAEAGCGVGWVLSRGVWP